MHCVQYVQRLYADRVAAMESGVTSSTRSVYDRMWARFLDGTYSAGDRLPEALLAQELGVSRTPVREALGRMLAEGLVTPAARGVVVAGLDREAMRRLFDFRRDLEGFAAELTTTRTAEGQIAPVWFTGLSTASSEFAAAVEKGNAAAATRWNMEFHGLVVEASGNEFVADAHRRAIARLSVSTALNLEHTAWAQEAAQQHEEIVTAIGDGDPVAARRLAEDHIRDAIRVFDSAT